MHGRAGRLEIPDRGEQLFEPHPQRGPGKPVREAVVGTHAQGDVPVGRSPRSECVRLVEHGPVPVGGTSFVVRQRQ